MYQLYHRSLQNSFEGENAWFEVLANGLASGVLARSLPLDPGLQVPEDRERTIVKTNCLKVRNEDTVTELQTVCRALRLGQYSRVVCDQSHLVTQWSALR